MFIDDSTCLDDGCDGKVILGVEIFESISIVCGEVLCIFVFTVEGLYGEGDGVCCWMGWVLAVVVVELAVAVAVVWVWIVLDSGR